MTLKSDDLIFIGKPVAGGESRKLIVKVLQRVTETLLAPIAGAETCDSVTILQLLSEAFGIAQAL